MNKDAILQQLGTYTRIEDFELDFLKVSFLDDSYIDKKQLISLFIDAVNADGNLNDSDKKEIFSYLAGLKNDKSEFDTFLNYLKIAISNKRKTDHGYCNNTIDTLTPDEFWPMSIIAIKKCLGSKHTRAKIVDKAQYFSLIGDPLNARQHNTHNLCINYFAANADDFTFNKSPLLKEYMHRLGSSNTKPRIQKKNVNRVVRRIRKTMILYKISHHGITGNIFSEGRYLVPDQFAECVKRIFLS